MLLLLKPTLGSVISDLDYEYEEDAEQDDILFQQGFDAEELEIEDGERFEIPEEAIGTILDDEEYFFCYEDPDGRVCKELICEDLEEGTYILDGDEIRRVY